MKELKIQDDYHVTDPNRTSVSYGEPGARIYFAGDRTAITILAISVDYDSMVPYQSVSIPFCEYDDVVRLRDFLTE